MSLRETLFSAVDSAFGAAGDLVRLGSFVSKSGADYDPITDTYAPAVTTANVRMIRTTVQQNEMEASAAQVEDSKFLVPSKDIKDIDANSQDYILYNGGKYNIIRVDLVPGGSLWIFYTRKA